MKIVNLFVLAFVLFLFSCKENSKKNTRPIILGDSSLIVSETDSQYLQNFTNDISPASKKSAEGSITKMMVQVDSANLKKKIEEENLIKNTLSGFTINFNECSVIFDKLLAHAINNNQDERKSNSVSYVKDGGDFIEMQIEIKGLENVSIEQRIFTKLSVENEQEKYILNDLGKYISPWYNLPGKTNKFVSVGSNSILYNNVDQLKIKNAVDREVRKKIKDASKINFWLSKINNTKSYNDEPCRVVVVSSQWRIRGNQNGKKIQKLIQFDIPI